MNIRVAEERPDSKQHDSHAAAEIATVNCETELKCHKAGYADVELAFEHHRNRSPKDENHGREQQQPRNDVIKRCLRRQQQEQCADEASGDTRDQGFLERYSFEMLEMAPDKPGWLQTILGTGRRLTMHLPRPTALR